MTMPVTDTDTVPLVVQAQPAMTRYANLVGASTRRLVLQPLRRFQVATWIVGGVGAVILILGLLSAIDTPIALVFAAFGAIFLGGAAAMRPRVITFDLDAGELARRGAIGTTRHAIEDIRGLQLLDAGFHRLQRSPTTYRAYQLNVVFTPDAEPARLNLLYDGDYDNALEAGRALAKALDVPFDVTYTPPPPLKPAPR